MVKRNCGLIGCVQMRKLFQHPQIIDFRQAIVLVFLVDQLLQKLTYLVKFPALIHDQFAAGREKKVIL